eukprot:gene4211-4460_t
MGFLQQVVAVWATYGFVLQCCLALAGSTSTSAKERDLTDINIKAALLAEEGNKYHHQVAARNFKGNVLGYVTPWNSHGYEVAERWRGKFSHISPVWYQLKAASEGSGASFQLTGGHDVDQQWISRLRTPVTEGASSDKDDAGSQTCRADFAALAAPHIVPRVIVELAPKHLMQLLQKPGEAIALVVDEVNKQQFEGVVLECWLQWSAMGGFNDAAFKEAALAFFKKLAANLGQSGKELLLAVPPVVPAQPGRPAADTSHLEQLADDVAGFSLMTYDYSGGPGAPGPNGPLKWQQENVQDILEDDSKVAPAQVLMGLNFYGYDYLKPEPGTAGKTDARPIMGNAFLNVLKKHKPKLKWEEQFAEHRIKYKEGTTRHTVYFPTPASLEARIDLARQTGTGLSIWELGQGMDAFMDL